MLFSKLNKVQVLFIAMAASFFSFSGADRYSVLAAEQVTDSSSVPAGTVESVEAAKQPESIVEVNHTGTGTGKLVVTGDVYYEYDVQVKITQSGNIGEAYFSISEDNGSSWSETTKISLSGYFQYDYLVLEFYCEEKAGKTSSEPAFVAGDIYSFYIQNPDTTIMINHTGNGAAEPEVISNVPEMTAFEVLEASGAHIRIEILKTGGIDTGVWRVSQDAGKTWTEEFYTSYELFISSKNVPDLCFTIRFTSDMYDNKNIAVFQKGDIYEIYPERIEDHTDVIGFVVLFMVAGIVGAGLYVGYIYLKRQIPSETEYHMNGD